MELLKIIFENPPKDDEKQTDYFQRIAPKLNKSPSATITAVKRILKAKGYKMGISGLRSLLANDQPDYQETGQTSITESSAGKTIEYKGEKSITSKKEAIEFFEIDEDEWLITKMKTNSWDVSMKAKDGSSFKRTNYQVSLWLSPRSFSYEALKTDLSLSIPSQKLKRSLKTPLNGSLMIEPCIFDHHFGKVGFDPKTMDYNWSLKEATNQYHKAINRFISEVRGNTIQEIVFAVGNDYFNIDTPNYTTTKGTPQMAGELWQKIYVAGCHTKVAGIQALAQVAPVRIKIVPGNHDHQLAFTLGEYLQAAFKDEDWITIDNTPEKRKYHLFGDVLTGYTHGDNIKASTLHHTMSVDVPELFGKSSIRHFKVGHLHKDSRKDVYVKNSQDEFNGVSVFWCPSLSPVDVWHFQKLYVGNERRSKAFIYHKTEGLEKIVYYNLK